MPAEVLDAGTCQSIVLAFPESLGQPEDRWLHMGASFATDLTALCMIAQCIRPKVVFEIGTLRGYTALHLALNTPPEAKIYTLDLPVGPRDLELPTTYVDDLHIEWSRQSHRLYTNSYPEAKKIRRVYGDSATFNFSPYHGSVDLFFIDGAHSYDYVRADTVSALKCLRPGGVIVWHDFGRVGTNGVSKWLKEFARGHAVFSVPGASLAFSRI